jgi:cytochrome b561
MNAATRYHPLLVALHWVLALLIGGALFFGAVKLVQISNQDPYKVEALRAHMTAGLVILALMGLRLLVRLRTTHPPAATTGHARLDGAARLSHRAFYIAVILMAGSGLFMAVQSGVIGIVAGAHPALPRDFWALPVRSVHYFLSRLLMILIAVHVIAVAYHSLLRKDRLLRRMGFGLSQSGTSRVWHVAPWFSTLVLIFAAFILSMIGVKFVIDPVSAAVASGMTLHSAVAVTNMRASFGAFPLACAIFIVICLASGSHRVTGLRFVAIVIGAVLLVRVFGIYRDGTLMESGKVLGAEAILMILSILGLFFERSRLRFNQLRIPPRPVSLVQQDAQTLAAEGES